MSTVFDHYHHIPFSLQITAMSLLWSQNEVSEDNPQSKILCSFPSQEIVLYQIGPLPLP